MGLGHRELRPRPLLVPAALVALAVVAWLPSLWARFVADDYILLFGARRVSSLGAPFGANWLGPEHESSFYRPLWNLWNAALHELFGASAPAFHAANLVLYAVIVCQVWLLARFLLDEAGAVIAAVAFALYPRHAESVVWVSGSTDLLAVPLVLASLLSLLAPWRLSLRLAGAALAGGAAVLVKEIAFVTPALAALMVLALAPRRGSGWERWSGPLAILGAQLATVPLRVHALGGIGGYGEDVYPWTPVRVAAAAVSDVVAALSPPQLDPLAQPALVAIPLGLLALGVWRFARVRQAAGGDVRSRVVLIGLAWFAIAIVPTLNLIVNLHTANGERFLFLPSVGLALVAAALLPRSVPARALAGVVGLGLCLHDTTNWIAAGRMADRVREAAVALGPREGELLLLAVPSSYRDARVFHVGLNEAVAMDPAVERAGGRRRTAWCAHVHVIHEAPGQVRFRAEGRSLTGTATERSPFLVRFRSSGLVNETPDCAYASDSGRLVGRSREIAVFPQPLRRPVRLAYFDGRTLRRCC